MLRRPVLPYVWICHGSEAARFQVMPVTGTGSWRDGLMGSAIAPLSRCQLCPS